MSTIIDYLSLWKHQRDAIEVVLKYVQAFKEGRTTKAALVQMPTGTGKTGVIAVLSRCIPSIGLVLVVAPRVALRDQLVRDISGRFFSHLQRKPSKIPKEVIAQDRLPVITSSRSLADKVVVITIQKLDRLRKNERGLYDRLRQATSLLVFDEGHYEPALVWREAIRAFPCPRVLFTATPYRNDFKIFDIDFEHHVSSYTFQKAVTERYIRRVEIVPVSHPHSPSMFVDQVVKFYDANLKSASHADREEPRVIIRCDRKESIRQISKLLNERGLSNIAIHENFKDRVDAPNEYHSVPDPDTTSATFWIHQFKLLEGIDDPRFQLLALYDELRTVKSFVQQVGRVIRNPRRDAGSIAYVLDHSNGRQQYLWNNFLAYDKVIAAVGLRSLAVGNEALLKILEQSSPSLTYVDGIFRFPSTLGSLNPDDDLQLPRTVNIVSKGEGFRLKDFFRMLIRKYLEEDRIVQTLPPDKYGLAVVFYVCFSNSPFLREKYFVESKLGVTILWESGQYLCYFDSLGRLLSHETLNGPVPATKLRRLFHRGNDLFLTKVALWNANPGASVIRSRSISAVKIGATAPTFDDHEFVCRIAEGYASASEKDDNVRGRVRRYVGFGHGKVSDLTGRWVTYGEYLKWLRWVVTTLQTKAEPEPTFDRYASTISTPEDKTPRNVLLDISEVMDQYITLSGEPIEIDDLCADVMRNKFSVLANRTTCHAEINYDESRREYIVSSRDLDSMYAPRDPMINPRGLTAYLNATQSFRVIPRSSGTFYALGDFFSPLIKFGPDYDAGKTGLLSSMFPVSLLQKTTREKGTKCLPRGKGWQQDCLFGLIDNLGKGSELAGYLDQTEVLVCDDMGAESADFIATVPKQGDNSARVCFIHAKASEKQPHFYSATELQTVCAQAQKNLGELAFYSMERSEKIQKWENPWSGKQGKVNSRIRRGGAAKEAWEKIRRVVQDPSADREVWLVLGGMLSKRKFTEELTRPEPKLAAVQGAYLLFSTLTVVRSVCTKFRVFCSP